MNAEELPIQDPLDIPPIGMYAPVPSEMSNDEVKETSEKETVVRLMHADETPSQDVLGGMTDLKAGMTKRFNEWGKEFERIMNS